MSGNIFNTTGALGTREIENGSILEMTMANVNLSRVNPTRFFRNTEFGFNDIISNTVVTLSPGVPVNSLDITYPTSAVLISVASTSTDDDVAGIGALTVRVRGLDANYREQDEIVILTGQTPVDTTNTFIRVNDLFVITAGSSGVNVGYIHASDSADTFTAGGEPNTRLYMSIPPTHNLSKTMVFTVPDGFLWTPKNLYIQTDATSTDTIEIKLYVTRKTAGIDIEQLQDIFYVQQGGVQINFENNRQMRSRDDFRITTERISGNGNKQVHMKLFSILKKLY